MSSKPNFVIAYEAGASVTEVASLLHCAVATARKKLVDAGVVIRGRGRPRKLK